MSESSKLPPRTEGFYIFDGVRQSRPGYVEILRDIVRVVETERGDKRLLAVCRWGRSTRWPLESFTGTWVEIKGL